MTFHFIPPGHTHPIGAPTTATAVTAVTTTTGSAVTSVSYGTGTVASSGHTHSVPSLSIGAPSTGTAAAPNGTIGNWGRMNSTGTLYAASSSGGSPTTAFTTWNNTGSNTPDSTGSWGPITVVTSIPSSTGTGTTGGPSSTATVVTSVSSATGTFVTGVSTTTGSFVTTIPSATGEPTID